MNRFLARFTFFNALFFAFIITSLGKSFTLDTGTVRLFLDKSIKFKKANPDSALYYASKAVEFLRGSKQYKYISEAQETLGECYIQQENFAKATDLFLEALKIEDDLNNQNRIADLSNNLGHIYFLMEQFNSSLEYYSKALKIYESSNDTLGIIKVLSGIGNLHNSRQYCEKRSDNQLREDYETAIKFYLQSLDLSKKVKDVESEMKSYIGLGCLNKNIGKPDIALKYLKLALDYYEKSDNLDSRLSVYYNLAMLYNATKEYPKAIDYFKKCINTSIENKLTQGIQFVYEQLSYSYRQSGQYKNAVESYINYMTIRDSVYNAEKSKQIFELETKYQTEKKETKIATLEKERKLFVVISSIGTLLLISLLVIFVIRHKSLKQGKLIVEQQVKQLEQEKKLIATNALLEGETAERTRLSKDLHDGLGGLLSVTKHKVASMKGSLTIPDDQVDTFNSALEMLDNSIRELRRVAHNLMPESLMRYGLNSAINDFCEAIDNVNYNFYGVEKRLDNKLEVASFRIVSELVNNALKHSKATIINVQLVQEEDRINMTVYDNGIGFNPNSIDRTKSSGLNNIESRVLSFNGRIDIFSNPAKGTEVSVEFKF